METMTEKSIIADFVIWFGLKKIWPYLLVLSYVGMWATVVLGNPLLPVQSLANYGWAWHHIAEILSFYSLGAWFGSFKLPQYNIYLRVTLVLVLVLLSVIQMVSFPSIVYAVLIIVSVPSFVGYATGFYLALNEKKKGNRPLH